MNTHFDDYAKSLKLVFECNGQDVLIHEYEEKGLEIGLLVRAIEIAKQRGIAIDEISMRFVEHQPDQDSGGLMGKVDNLLGSELIPEGTDPDAASKLSNGRIEGCQSANHAECYGELWQCEQCSKIICYAEGYDDEYIELCDDCWFALTTATADTAESTRKRHQEYPIRA